MEPFSVERLSKIGWTESLSEEKMKEVKSKRSQQVTPAGTLKQISVSKMFGESGRLDLSPRTISYSFVFEACASQKNVRAPEIIVTSDSESKSVKLATMLEAGKCRTSSVIIKASDPSTISGKLLNKGKITGTLDGIESKIASLQEQLATERKSLSDLNKITPRPENYGIQVSETNKKISEIKKELTSSRSELHKYMLFLHSTPQQKILPKPALKTITGAPLDMLQTNIISITKQVSKPAGLETGATNYNVVFEACAGKNIVRLPVVELTSDQEIRTVAIADKISPNSCQVAVGKILAKDVDSIDVGISESESSIVAELEEEISRLLDNIQVTQTKLNKLVTERESVTNYEEKVSTLTEELVSIRGQILEAKSQLHAVLLETYR